MEKEGFIYIWYDRKHKKYYLGCHYGTINDGYICSSNNMRNNYKNRPKDFKRRILKRKIKKEELLSEEHKWLSLIKDHELGKKYYNLYTTNTALRLAWAAAKGRKQTIEEKEKRAESLRGKKRTLETRKKISAALSGEKNYNYGKTLSIEVKKKISEALTGEKNPFYGKKHDLKLKKKMNKKTSQTMKGRPPNNAKWTKNTFWWNNGIKNKRSHVCPGDNWAKGMI